MYISYLQQVKLLNLEQRGTLFTALLLYASGEELPEMDGMTLMCFEFIRRDMDENREKYEAMCNARREAGKKGGRPKTKGSVKKAKEPNVFPEKQEEAKEKEEKQKRFTPPSVEEVRAYVNETGYSVDPQRFVDFYASKGWMVGKNKMKDWKAAVRTWNRSEEPKTTKFNNFHERDYDFDDLERQLLSGGGL